MRKYASYADQELLRRLNQDDADALAEIYDRYAKDLYVTAKNTLHSAASAEDIVQEVFLSLWQRRAVLKIDALQPYLHQTVRYLVLHLIRKEKSDADFYKRLHLVSVDILEEEPLLFKELLTLIPELIASLPDDQRQIFLMHREQNISYRQIAEQLGISVKTVEKKMSLSLKFLRLHINKALAVLAGTHLLP